MGRKFKKKLAQKPVRKKAEPVLSVELVRKETLEKVGGIWNQLISKFRKTKLTV